LRDFLQSSSQKNFSKDQPRVFEDSYIGDAMKDIDRDELSSILEEYLEKIIYVDLKLRMPNGRTLFEGLGQLLNLVLYYFAPIAEEMGLSESEARKFFWEFARKFVAKKLVIAFEDTGKILSVEEILNP
jgi:hypothetical protein